MKRKALVSKSKNALATNSLFRAKPSLTSSFYASRHALTRQEAIERVVRQLKRKCRETSRPDLSVSLDEAGYLISLFQLQPEELSEAGLSYEQLKCLDKHFF